MSAIVKRFLDNDILILNILNRSIKCSLLDWFMPKITYLGSTQFSVSLCIVLLLYPAQITKAFSITLIRNLITSTLIVWVIKLFFHRQRPFIKLTNIYVRKISVDNYSFPSAHSAASFSIALTASLFFPHLTLIFIALAVCVAVSRIYLGVHYPTDVLIGIIIGVAPALALCQL